MAANLALAFPKVAGNTALPLGRVLGAEAVISATLADDVVSFAAAFIAPITVSLSANLTDDTVSFDALFLAPVSGIIDATLADDSVAFVASFAAPITASMGVQLADDVAVFSASFAPPIYASLASTLNDDAVNVSASFIAPISVSVSALLADDAVAFDAHIIPAIRASIGSVLSDDSVAFIAYTPIIITIVDSTQVSDSASFGATTANPVVDEATEHQDAYSTKANASVSVADTHTASDIITFIHKMSVAESFQQQSGAVITGHPSLAINESNVIAGAALGYLRATYEVTEAQQYTSSVVGVYTIDVDYSFGAADAVVSTARASLAVSEQSTAVDSLIHNALVTVTVDEAYQSSEATAFHASALIAVAELVNSLSAVDTANKSFFTYALNTLLGATSRYGNYGFNSFAATDDACYGANDTGLYLLEGDNDNGYTIPAGIRSNKSDLASDAMEGTKHKTVSHAYVGMSSDGDMILQVISSSGSDSETNSYRIDQKGIAAKDTTRVQLGKGVKARYWQFTLANEQGKNFDIDAFEFLPIPMTRRI